MRKRIIFSTLAFLLALFLGLTLFVRGAFFPYTDPVEGTESIAYLDERLPGLMRTYDIPGVVITLIEDGKPAWSRAYGFADRESGRPMTTDTYCRVESISKSVTAWGVLRLVEQGLVDLDAPVQGYLADWTFPPSDYPVEAITVRQLLSHSAGLELGTIGVRYAPGAPRPTLREALSRDAVLMQAPGRGFSYSNVGFNLLELLIESVTGRDFADYMREEVLRPLGMEHADFDWQPSFQPPVANGYDQDGTPIPVYVYPERASGGLFARAGDIAAFVAAGMPNYTHHGRRVLSPAGIEQLYTPVLDIGGAYGLVYDAYGLGHFIEWLPGGEKSVAHGGQGSGWMTHFQSVPATGDGIVLLTNSQRSWPFFGHVLSDWARWRNLGSVGMGKIVAAGRALWVVTALLFLLAGWQVGRLTRDWRAARRHLAPLAVEGRGRRLAQGGGGILILALLFWAATQPYLFFSAVFPVATPWLGGALFLLAIVLLLSAALPRRGEDHLLVQRGTTAKAGTPRRGASSPVRN